jgi:DNA-binding transcriptional LysR family regulator
VRDVDIRLLRYFVAAAEELHFTRAASRLFIAQQALSREIRRLEDQLEVTLFERTTRSVALTVAGERLLPQARRRIEIQDEMLEDLRGETQPLVVDVLGEGLTPWVLLETVREEAPHLDFVARFSGGLGAALGGLLAHRMDVVFGRIRGLDRPLPPDLAARTIRLEPLGLLLLEDHPLSARSAVPLDALVGVRVDASSGNPAAPEWVDLAHQLLRYCGAQPSDPHHTTIGPHETARHIREHGLPILTMLTTLPVPGTVLRPLIKPVPVYPWAMVYRSRQRHPGTSALAHVAEGLASGHGWLDLPSESWLPEPDRRELTEHPPTTS